MEGDRGTNIQHPETDLESLPLEELFGEGAIVAVGGVFEAEVVVDLQEGLVLPEFAEEPAAVGTISKETGGRPAYRVTRDSCGQGTVGGPRGFGVRLPPTGDVVVGEKLVGAGVPA